MRAPTKKQLIESVIILERQVRRLKIQLKNIRLEYSKSELNDYSLINRDIASNN